MPLVYAICAVVLTIAITVGVVYAVLALKQIRKTAAAAQNFFEHADVTASVLSQYSQKASSLLHKLEGGLGRLGQVLPIFAKVGAAVRNRFHNATPRS